MNTTQIGRCGEDAAARYLVAKGYMIVERNFRTHTSELDIIAYSKEGMICFVEVKTRKNADFGYPCEAVNYRKRTKITQGAMSYIRSKQIECEVRFDVIEVYGEFVGGVFAVSKLNHIKNAF